MLVEASGGPSEAIELTCNASSDGFFLFLFLPLLHMNNCR